LLIITLDQAAGPVPDAGPGHGVTRQRGASLVMALTSPLSPS
jgi:hypothetical protein